MPMYIRFTELPAQDQNRAVQFYTEKLGFRVAQNQEYHEGWQWVTLEIPAAQTRILLTRSDGAIRDVPSLVLTVDDVYQSYQELKKKAVVFTQEPTEAPWNAGEVFAVFRDSEGNLVMLGSETSHKEAGAS